MCPPISIPQHKPTQFWLRERAPSLLHLPFWQTTTNVSQSLFPIAVLLSCPVCDLVEERLWHARFFTASSWHFLVSCGSGYPMGVRILPWVVCRIHNTHMKFKRTLLTSMRATNAKMTRTCRPTAKCWPFPECPTPGRPVRFSSLIVTGFTFLIKEVESHG